MSVRFLVVVVMSVFAFFFYAADGIADEQKGFDEDELKKFCQEFPLILNSMNSEEKDRFFRDVISDYTHVVFPQSMLGDPRLSLQPQRYIYVLNHIILAGVIEDMGGFGEGQLAFMKNEREKVKNNPKLPSDKREQTLAELNNDIERLNKTVIQAKSIPRYELVLIWKEKDALNAMLRGKFPIQKKQMARQ
jgi:hypothetical protein